MMTTIDERIAALEEKLKQEKAKKQKIEARKRAAELQKKRSDDTRRKILVGAAVLEKVERGEWSKENMLFMLDAALTRPEDRALFGLNAVSDSEKPPYKILVSRNDQYDAEKQDFES